MCIRDSFYDADEKWDFSSFQPDVVCVNLGTNDMSVNKGDSVRYENAALPFEMCIRDSNGFEPLTPCLQSRCSSQLS